MIFRLAAENPTPFKEASVQMRRTFFLLWTRLYEIMLEAQNKSRPLIYIYMLRAPWSFCDTYAEGSALRSHPQFTRLNLNSRIRSITSTITISSLKAAGKKKKKNICFGIVPLSSDEGKKCKR